MVKYIETKEEFEEIKQNDSYSFYQHISIVSQDDFGLIFDRHTLHRKCRHFSKFVDYWWKIFQNVVNITFCVVFTKTKAN